ncbi:MAG: glycosyltransferase family 39 protein [Planctomycetaceae bacterium]
MSKAAIDRSSLSVAAAILAVHAGLLSWTATRLSPTCDEPAHITAGLSYWRFGSFDLYRVNPPLTRLVAAVPLLDGSYEEDWRSVGDGQILRSEFRLGDDFAERNGRRFQAACIAARRALIPCVVLGGCVCFCWARELFGPIAGVAAAGLWAFSPDILGHGSLVTPDATAAAMGALAGYTFWRWLTSPGWIAAFTAGVCLGLALLTKFTLLVLVPLWPAMWLVYRTPTELQMPARAWLRQLGQLVGTLLLALYMIHAGYGFEGGFRPLGTFTFYSGALTGQTGLRPVQERAGNRFRETSLGSVPVPVPANYLEGLDVQKVDFERGGNTYLGGNTLPGGIWYWYMYAFAMKEPAALWLLLAASIGWWSSKVRRSPFDAAPFPTTGGNEPQPCFRTTDLFVLLVPAAAVLALVSWNHSLCHYRYAIPALPFVFVLAGGAVSAVSRKRPAANLFIVGSLMWYAASSLAVTPFWLSYFNEFAGGPTHGWKHLSDSALDWGQGLVELRQWHDEHPEANPLWLAYHGTVDPRLMGIAYQVPPVTPEAGWYAISANYFADERGIVTADGRMANVATGTYAWLRTFEPVYRAADVIYVYRVTPAEAEHVRQSRVTAE